MQASDGAPHGRRNTQGWGDRRPDPTDQEEGTPHPKPDARSVHTPPFAGTPPARAGQRPAITGAGAAQTRHRQNRQTTWPTLCRHKYRNGAWTDESETGRPRAAPLASSRPQRGPAAGDSRDRHVPLAELSPRPLHHRDIEEVLQRASGRLISHLRTRRPGSRRPPERRAGPLVGKALRRTSARMVGVGRADL